MITNKISTYIHKAWIIFKDRDDNLARIVMSILSWILCCIYLAIRSKIENPTVIYSLLNSSVIPPTIAICLILLILILFPVFLISLNYGIDRNIKFALHLGTNIRRLLIFLKFILIFEIVCIPFYILDWFMGWKIL